MEVKPKKCKGTGKANGYGCGSIQLVRRYGLGVKCGCFRDWLLNTDEGKVVMGKSILSTVRKFDKKKKAEISERKRSTINYSGKLQSKVQEIARLIDLGHPCLATDKMALSYDGGHVFNKGSHPECRYNLHNIFSQASNSNRSTQDDALMILGVERVFGIEYRNFIETIKNKPVLSLQKKELEQIYRKACKIASNLTKEGKYHTLTERIEVRNMVNKELSIYPIELCVFDV